MILDLIHRIRRKLMKIRLQPIRVFCFHHVSDMFDASTMWECDWTQINQFKRNIEQLKKRYTFIPLQEAYKILNHDWIRTKAYAVLTADDGWASLKNILPWLAEQQIPITLFVNPAYLKGKDTRENGMSGLLTMAELKDLLDKYPNIAIGSHGWNHTLATEIDINDFDKGLKKCQTYLQESGKYVPFYAYPCGKHTMQHDECLNHEGIVPVYMDGEVNYKYDMGIHRELLDGLSL